MLKNHSHRQLRTNQVDLVMVAVMGQVAHPVAGVNPFRIGNDGVPRVLPGTGGIVINKRIGDPCVGLMADHIEPGVALHNNNREVIGGRRGPNLALLTYACIGNIARVISGPCTGKRGMVTGKHGGVDHVLLDFSSPTLLRMQIGDRIQIYSYGMGLRLLDYPSVSLSNCSPTLLNRLGIVEADGQLSVPVSHRIPAGVMGSGLGKNSPWRGDYDIQLFDLSLRRRHRLDTLRFGDVVAICDGDARFGPSYRSGMVTIGLVVHGDSTVSGHGPGVTILMSGPSAILKPLSDPRANLAAIYRVREPAPLLPRHPLAGRPHTTDQTVWSG
jgi:hypothetical protein